MTANDRFEQFVRQHKGRLTPHRQFIVQEFLALNGHYDVQELHELFRKKGRDINPSTIFRTLKLLVQAGVAVERQFANGNTKFDVNVAHHDHVICLGCNTIAEFDSPKLEQMQNRIVRRMGFDIVFHKHEVYGYCPSCRNDRKNYSGGK